jgi:hypothetical protein
LLAFQGFLGYNREEKDWRKDMTYDFIADLDGYFCEKYANYDKLCVLPGYKMPLMQASELDEFGRTRTYTLPSNTMRLALQEKKAELLALLKTKMTDTTFSFSFQPLSFFASLKSRFSKYGFTRNFKKMLAKYGVSEGEAFSHLDIPEEVWRKICKGKFLPTKNLIFSIALTSQLSFDDTEELLAYSYEEFDYAIVKDVVIAYLLQRRVYSEGMIAAALAEYKIANLFIK